MRKFVAAMCLAAAFLTGDSVNAAKDKNVSLGQSVSLFKIDVVDQREAWLINVSPDTQYVFIDSQRQPAKLRLFDSIGTEVDVTDERAREKFDNMIHGKESFIPLPTGQRTSLLKIDLHREVGYIELRAGPYRCAVRPGKYVAMIEWTSERNDYLDDSGRPHKNTDVWLGTVQSGKFELDIQ